MRSLLEERIREIAHGQANSYGCVAHVDYFRGYPPWSIRAGKRISPSLSRWSLSARSRWIWSVRGHGQRRLRLHAGKKPGCYLFIGNGSIGSKGGNTIHNPNYDFNDDNVAIGCAYWYLLAKRYLVPFDADH